MKSIRGLVVGAALAAFSLAAAQSVVAGTFTLSNSDPRGDGYVTGGPGTYDAFDLFGADDGAQYVDGPFENLTTYTQTAAGGHTYLATFTYTTDDFSGPFWDPAGVVVGDKYTQLSPNILFASNTTLPAPVSYGPYTYRFYVPTGETWGFFVYSYDSLGGRGDIAVTLTDSIPEPGAWALMLLGVGGIGAMARNRRRALPATAA